MTLRKFAAHVAMAALAAAFMFGTAGVGEAAAAKKAKAPSKAEWCNFQHKPVCGTYNGKRTTFSNECWAKREGAKKIKPGACK